LKVLHLRTPAVPNIDLSRNNSENYAYQKQLFKIIVTYVMQLFLVTLHMQAHSLFRREVVPAHIKRLASHRNKGPYHNYRKVIRKMSRAATRSENLTRHKPAHRAIRPGRGLQRSLAGHKSQALKPNPTLPT
jgi:hypothetical protein